MQAQVGNAKARPPVPNHATLRTHGFGQQLVLNYEQRRYQERAGPLCDTVWSDTPTSDDPHNARLHDELLLHPLSTHAGTLARASGAHCQRQARNGPNARLTCGRLLQELDNHVTACRAGQGRKPLQDAVSELAAKISLIRPEMAVIFDKILQKKKEEKGVSQLVVCFELSMGKRHFSLDATAFFFCF